MELPVAAFPVGDAISVAFWAQGGDKLPSQNCVLGATIHQSDGRILLVHLPWTDHHVYFDCGVQGGHYDRINKRVAGAEYKGGWTHWATAITAPTAGEPGSG